MPSGPEPLKFSPDGRFLTVGAENSTTKLASHPFHADRGPLAIYAVDGHDLPKLDQQPVGGRLEAVTFSRDGRTVMIQNMQDRIMEVFRWDGHKLRRGKSLRIGNAGPGSFATAWP